MPVRNVVLICKECGGRMPLIFNFEIDGDYIIQISGENRHVIGCKYCNCSRLEVEDYYEQYQKEK